MSLLRLPPVPRFDPEKDGNPYQWIAQNAPMVRAKQEAVMENHRRMRRIEARIYNRAVKP